MKIIKFKRKIKHEKYYSSAMGALNSKVIYIKKCVLGFPIKTIHKYRETYNKEVKNCDEYSLFI